MIPQNTNNSNNQINQKLKKKKICYHDQCEFFCLNKVFKTNRLQTNLFFLILNNHLNKFDKKNVQIA